MIDETNALCRFIKNDFKHLVFFLIRHLVIYGTSKKHTEFVKGNFGQICQKYIKHLFAGNIDIFFGLEVGPTLT